MEEQGRQDLEKEGGGRERSGKTKTEILGGPKE